MKREMKEEVRRSTLLSIRPTQPASPLPLQLTPMQSTRSLVPSLRRTLAAAQPLASSSSPRRSLPAFQSARGVQTQSLEERINELQGRQKKLADKAGRMKQMPGVMAAIPVFANHIRPRSTRKTPGGLSLGQRWQYLKLDSGNDIYTYYLRKFDFKKALGKGWEAHFLTRTKAAYEAMNQSLSHGNYTNLMPLASGALLDSVKAQRSKISSSIQMSWKVHGEIEQEIICIRQQEISKTDEFVAQIAVRFASMQSLELRDSRGTLIGKGDHSKPKKVTEFFVFQREMWRPEDDWKLVKKVSETDPLDPLASMNM